METNTVDMLIQVMKDNLDQCKKNKILYESIKNTRKAQKVIFKKEKIDIKPVKTSNKAKMIVSKKKTLEAASAYTGKKTAILNFANAFHPGGGCLYGAKAQEECLCRVSTLYECLIDKNIMNDFYIKHRKDRNDLKLSWLGTSDLIYSPNVMVFMSDDLIPESLTEDVWFNADVITCAAPEVPDNKKKSKKLRKVLENRIERIFQAAAANEVKVLILGAFGCGVFNNPPEVIAKIMFDMAEKYASYFDVIEFAVYDPSKEKTNLKAFKKEKEKRNGTDRKDYGRLRNRRKLLRSK